MVSNGRVRRMKETFARVPPEKIGSWFSSAPTSLVATLVISIFFAILSAAAVVPYTKEMFAEGLNKAGFVVITLRQAENGSERRICTLEAQLLGAIHTQYHIDYDKSGRKRAEQIALSHWDKPFTFTNPKAVTNVKASYTRSQLAEVRKRLSKYDKSELAKQLSDPYGALHDVYTHPYRESYRDAVAHVLLENGVLVGVDDRTPLLRPLEEDDRAPN
jgi:hypothetical protein